MLEQTLINEQKIQIPNSFGHDIFLIHVDNDCWELLTEGIPPSYTITEAGQVIFVDPVGGPSVGLGTSYHNSSHIFEVFKITCENGRTLIEVVTRPLPKYTSYRDYVAAFVDLNIEVGDRYLTMDELSQLKKLSKGYDLISVDSKVAFANRTLHKHYLNNVPVEALL